MDEAQTDTESAMTEREDDCVARLADLVGMPDAAGEEFDWAQAEASVGLSLPADYKRLVEHFPEGRFKGVLGLLRPAVEDGATEFPWYFDRLHLDGIHEAWQENPASFAYPIYPEQGGLLPCIEAVGQGYYFWLTESSDPDEWPIVVAYNEYAGWVRYDKTLCAFLTEVITGAIDLTLYGIDAASQSGFVPHIAPSRPNEISWYSWREALPKTSRVRNEFATLANFASVPSSASSRNDWAGVESALGVELPADYKSFADVYGAGYLGDILVTTPNAEGNANIFNLIDRAVVVANELLGESRNRPFFPEPGGLIAWGATADNWLCCWAPTTSDPNKWGTVVLAGDASGFEIFELSFSQFIMEYIKPRYASIFGGRRPQREPGRFIPL